MRSFGFDYPERFRSRCSRQYFRFALFQNALDQIARVRFVVDDEYFYPGKIHLLERETSRRRRAGMNPLGSSHTCIHGHQRKVNGERRSTAFALTLCLDGSAVQFGQMLHDRQSQTQTAIRTRGGRIALSKSLENIRQETGPLSAHRSLPEARYEGQ